MRFRERLRLVPEKVGRFMDRTVPTLVFMIVAFGVGTIFEFDRIHSAPSGPSHVISTRNRAVPGRPGVAREEKLMWMGNPPAQDEPRPAAIEIGEAWSHDITKEPVQGK